MSFIDREHQAREGIPVFPPLIPLAAMLVAGLLERAAPLGWPAWPTAAAYGGTAPLLVGLGLMLWAIVHQIRRGTDPNPHNTTSALVTDGPYRFTRNPIYLADLFVHLGLALLLSWWWGLLLLAMTWAGLRFLVIAREERFLHATFGDDYAAYQQRTRRWL